VPKIGFIEFIEFIELFGFIGLEIEEKGERSKEKGKR
jgi:hypothetical protein